MPIQKNIFFHLSTIGIFLLLKILYTQTDTNDLLFLLQPTNTLIELINNSPSVYSQLIGYYHADLNIVINKSCSGFNFWILCFVMLNFKIASTLKNTLQYILATASILIGAYMFTIFVNTSRITFSIFMTPITNSIYNNTPPNWLHEAEGSFIYLSFLIIIYLGFDHILSKFNKHEKHT